MGSTMYGIEPRLGEEGTVEEGTYSSEEEGFMQGYSDEDEEVVCDECGAAIHGRPIIKDIDGEKHKFCSEDCVKEFEESIA